MAEIEEERTMTKTVTSAERELSEAREAVAQLAAARERRERAKGKLEEAMREHREAAAVEREKYEHRAEKVAALHRARPDWSQIQIALELGLHRMDVHRILGRE